MAQINDNYLKLQAGYLFPEISRRITEFTQANPEATVIRLGIGDVTKPLVRITSYNVCYTKLLRILALILGLSGCGKKGPVRPVDSDLSTPVHTQPINDCSG